MTKFFLTSMVLILTSGFKPSITWAQTQVNSDADEEASAEMTMMANRSKESPRLSHYFSNLKDAKTGKAFDLSSVKSKYSVWVLFQRDCPTCHMMFKELPCGNKDQNTSHLVGVLDEPAVLLKDAQSQSYKGPVYHSKESLESIMDLNVTPTVFVFKGKDLIKRVDNFVSCSGLKKIMSSH